MTRIGLDVDGIFSDFNAGFVPLVIAVTGKSLFGDDPRSEDFPHVWDYPQAYGHSEAELAEVWRVIKKDPAFWYMLPAYEGTVELLARVREVAISHEVTFVTARPGIRPRHQTEHWLQRFGYAFPTVVVTADKAAAMRLLNLDVYIDDKLGNANAVMAAVREDERLTRVYLKEMPYNHDGGEGAGSVRDPGLQVVSGVGEMLEKEGL